MFWKKKEPKEECNHSIGDNTSTEVYVWKGRNQQPYKHYVKFKCELCGEYVSLVYEDSYLKAKDY